MWQAVCIVTYWMCNMYNRDAFKCNPDKSYLDTRQFIRFGPLVDAALTLKSTTYMYTLEFF